MKVDIATLLRKEFKSLRVAMRSLDRTLRRVGTASVSAPSSNGTRRRMAVSPKRRSALVLQGRYMGYMRQLKPKQKALVKQLKVSRGVRVAIVRARAMAEARSR